MSIFSLEKPLWDPSELADGAKQDSIVVQDQYSQERSLLNKDSDASQVPESGRNIEEQAEFDDKTSRHNYPSERQSMNSNREMNLQMMDLNSRPILNVDNDSLTFEHSGEYYAQRGSA